MFISYTNLSEFLNSCQNSVFIFNNVNYLPGRDISLLKARSIVTLTTVLETSPVEVIGVVSLVVEAPEFEAKYAADYKSHFDSRNNSARALLEKYITSFRPDLKFYSGLLSNNGLTEAIEKIGPAQQEVWKLITSRQGRAIQPLDWYYAQSKRLPVDSDGQNRTLLDAILTNTMVAKEASY